MKYDSSIVGEKVINAAGKEGTIICVSRDGAVKVKFVGNAIDGEFMFDPFLSGHITYDEEKEIVMNDPKLRAVIEKFAEGTGFLPRNTMTTSTRC